jgi:acyl dehydratase
MTSKKANNYTFEEIKVGMKESFAKEISSQDMENFLKISGDTNPLHSDDAFAKSKGFKERVVYGMLTASLLSTLAGVYIPGKNSLILSTETNFLLPCYVGDMLNVEGEVTEKKEFGNLINLKVDITNQNNKAVLKGKMLIKVQNDKPK